VVAPTYVDSEPHRLGAIATSIDYILVHIGLMGVPQT
jgi:hypothetical protein